MYNFSSARKRREKLVGMYRALKHTQPDDETWSWWIMAQIEEIDNEIAEAHRNAEKTVLADGRSEKRIYPFVAPIVAQVGR